MKYYIGVDLGGTNIAAGLVDESFKIIHTSSVKTNLPRPQNEIEGEIARLCNKLSEEANVSINNIAAIGVGTPGSVNPQLGIVEFNANFGYHNWQLAKNLEKLLPCKVFIENDANAAAYGEYVAGAAKGARLAVAVTLGTGIGSGIIIDGKIYSGFNFAGAELGHMVIVKDGRPCQCGRNGCFEKYASARALTEDTKAAMLLHKDNIMWDIANGSIDNVNAKTSFDAMRQGDKLAKDIIESYIDYLACGITNIINIFQPEILCIGGGLSREGKLILDPLQKIIDKQEYARGGVSRTKIVTASLFNDAGIIGAALLGTQA